jgi:hypothetical protein
MAIPEGFNPERPECPKCQSGMWDNRKAKRSPKAPDFKCKDKGCDGAVWMQPKGGNGGGGGGGRPGGRFSIPHVPPEQRGAGRVGVREYYLKLMGSVAPEMAKIATANKIPLEMKDVQAATFSMFSEMAKKGYLDDPTGGPA